MLKDRRALRSALKFSNLSSIPAIRAKITLGRQEYFPQQHSPHQIRADLREVFSVKLLGWFQSDQEL
ncbi:MAG: hypothetical protein HC934_07870 [Acaryochloridaceae cyanobacterium SU_2_1]|nr:hypothetical protein [Acaryochloridaceae cyanobacterium SU_2_1]NJM95390.1 hypothetical protein [Acaryochloridaceae cyanobacterium CSU_5_19]